MDKQISSLQRQLFERDLIIQNLKAQLQQLLEFKNQVSLAFQKLPQEDGPASIQTCHDVQNQEPAAECKICMLDVHEDDILFSLDCKHEFHLGCLFKCLESRFIVNQCPLCTSKITSEICREISSQWKDILNEEKRLSKILLEELKNENSLDL